MIGKRTIQKTSDSSLSEGSLLNRKLNHKTPPQIANMKSAKRKPIIMNLPCAAAMTISHIVCVIKPMTKAHYNLPAGKARFRWDKMEEKYCKWNSR
jgi:hypothetical protein